MPTPPAPADSAIVAQLLTELAKIGGAGDWLTDPDLLQEGAPGEAPDDAKPLQLFLDHYQTLNRDQESSDNQAHAWTTKSRIWIAVKIVAGDATFGRAKLRDAAADVWRTLQAAEGTFATLSAAEGLEFGSYLSHRDLESAGWALGSIDVDVKRSQLHATP